MTIPLAHQLVALRRLRGVSQRDLAKMTGLGPATIWRLETLGNEPALRTLRAIVAALNGRIVIEIEPVENVDEDREAAIENERAALRYLRALLKEHGINDRLDWPDWIAAIRKHLSATAKKGT